MSRRQRESVSKSRINEIRSTKFPHPDPLPKGEGTVIEPLEQLPLPLGEGADEGSNYTNQAQACHDSGHQNNFETVSRRRRYPLDRGLG